MINIRPVSDLRNKYSEIEEQVKRDGPVFLTKNGYGSMVVMSVEQYSAMTDEVELKLDEAERAAAMSDVRLTHDEVFHETRTLIYAREAI